MIRRVVTAAAGVTMAAVLLSGCLGATPEPAPTPTGVFASEEEAFAAAEETYRAYVESANEVDLADPSTFEPMFEWTTGELEGGARKSFSQMHADGWVVDGQTIVTLVEPLDASPNLGAVQLAVCQDVSAVTVIDAGGQSVVSPTRPSVQALVAQLVAKEGSPTGYLVEKVDGRDGEPPCGG